MSSLFGDEPQAKSSLYFPPAGQQWSTVDPQSVGWDKTGLDAALEYAIRNRSTGVVVLLDGKIMAERYRDLDRLPAEWKQRIIVRTDERGRGIEDVASCQKSVVSVLVGIAKHKQLVKLDDPVGKYLGSGWSNASVEQESAIKIRHLLTMTSGLTERGTFEADAGTRWKYNTAMYAKLMDVLEKVTSKARNPLTKEWLTEPLGMADSDWVKRNVAGTRTTNQYGFATSARDLARFGLLMLADGDWDGNVLVQDKQYLSKAITTSQKQNPFYGFLWWLNHSELQPNGKKPIQSAPRDMFVAKGKGIRRCWVVPSLGLVVTRLGAPPTNAKAFDQEFWKRLMQAKR
ncbi:MAG: serine hydrolase [Rubripirellula sp.]|nr:serine hydrolase [Rubripirellula sp.]